MNLLASYALNDVVFSRQWPAPEGDVSYSIRYTGVSAGTVYFRVRRRTKSTTSLGSMWTIPESWEVRVPLQQYGKTEVAVAAWRSDESAEGVELRYYIVSYQNILIEIEAPPEKAKERQVGFRAAIEESGS